MPISIWALLGHARTPSRPRKLHCFGIGGYVRLGSVASVWPRTDDFRSTPVHRHRYRAPGFGDGWVCQAKTETRKVPDQANQTRAIVRKQAMEILVASLLANAGLSQSIEDVLVLTTKLRIVRTCVADLMEPLDREVRSDCIQFGQHLLGHFRLASGSIG